MQFAKQKNELKTGALGCGPGSRTWHRLCRARLTQNCHLASPCCNAHLQLTEGQVEAALFLGCWALRHPSIIVLLYFLYFLMLLMNWSKCALKSFQLALLFFTTFLIELISGSREQLPFVLCSSPRPSDYCEYYAYDAWPGLAVHLFITFGQVCASRANILLGTYLFNWRHEFPALKSCWYEIMGIWNGRTKKIF